MTPRSFAMRRGAVLLAAFAFGVLAAYAAELVLGIAVVAVGLAHRDRLRIPGGSTNATN